MTASPCVHCGQHHPEAAGFCPMTGRPLSAPPPAPQGPAVGYAAGAPYAPAQGAPPGHGSSPAYGHAPGAPAGYGAPPGAPGYGPPAGYGAPPGAPGYGPPAGYGAPPGAPGYGPPAGVPAGYGAPAGHGEPSPPRAGYAQAPPGQPGYAQGPQVQPGYGSPGYGQPGYGQAPGAPAGAYPGGSAPPGYAPPGYAPAGDRGPGYQTPPGNAMAWSGSAGPKPIGVLLSEAFDLYRKHLAALLVTCAVLIGPAVLAQSAAVTLILAPTAVAETAARSTARLSQQTSAEIQRQFEQAQGDPKKLEQLSREQRQHLEDLSRSLTVAGTAALGGIAAMLLGLLAFVITLGVMYGLAIPLTTGALTILVADRVTGGQASPGDAWKIMLKRLPRLLGAAIPAFVLVLLGLLFFVLPGLVLSFLFVFVTPVVLLENVGGTAALKRSVALVKANTAQVFIVGLVFSAIRMVASFVTHMFVPSTAFFLDSMVSGALMMLLLPLPIVGTVLLYLDIRRQADGLTSDGLRAGVEGLRRA